METGTSAQPTSRSLLLSFWPGPLPCWSAVPTGRSPGPMRRRPNCSAATRASSPCRISSTASRIPWQGARASVRSGNSGGLKARAPSGRSPGPATPRPAMSCRSSRPTPMSASARSSPIRKASSATPSRRPSTASGNTTPTTRRCLIPTPGRPCAAFPSKGNSTIPTKLWEARLHPDDLRKRARACQAVQQRRDRPFQLRVSRAARRRPLDLDPGPRPHGRVGRKRQPTRLIGTDIDITKLKDEEARRAAEAETDLPAAPCRAGDGEPRDRGGPPGGLCAGPPGPAVEPRQPPRLCRGDRAAVERRQGGAGVCRAVDRPRPLQAGQRHARPCRRRPRHQGIGAAAGRSGPS